MSIDKLKQILKPPNYRTLNDQKSFEYIERQLGSSLPTDYKDFVLIYGVGLIDDFIWVFSPFVENENLNFMSKKDDILESYKLLKSQFPNDYRHNIYPDCNGLLPWGITENGDELFWLVNGIPEHWKVVVYGSRSEEYIEYNCTLTEFLYKLLTRKIKCRLFPDEFPNKLPHFTKF